MTKIEANSKRNSSFTISLRVLQAMQAAAAASSASAAAGVARGRVLVFGAAGTFGSRICGRLLKEPGVELAVAGRSRFCPDKHACRMT
jgi:FlaA1/EpsC-like NDP-sugar epimerase